MKKILLLSLISIGFNSISQDQLNNNGFNNWTNNTVAKTPNSWKTIYDLSGSTFSLTDVPLTSSSDASHQSNSMRLKTVSNGQDMAFGFILLGDIGNNGPEGGVPFTLNADSLLFDAKFDIKPGDSANVYVILKNSGIPIDMQVIRIGGVQSNWKTFSYPINSLNLVPDSLILGFTSSETQNASPIEGSWFMVDNVKFASGNNYSSPIPNPSFESLTNITSTTPDNWFTYNSLISPSGAQTVIKSTDVQEGAFAMLLKADSIITIDNSYKMDAIAIYGEYDSNIDDFVGRPFVASPENLSAYFKWLPDGQDTAYFAFGFKGQGQEYFKDTNLVQNINQYTQINFPIDLAFTPDTVLVYMIGGKSINSQLFVDNLLFSGGDVSVKQIQLNENTMSIFPNPSSSDAFVKLGLIKNSTVSYTVLNSLGQVIENESLGLMKEGVHQIKLDSKNYNNGIYFVKVKIGESIQMQKLIIK